MNGVHCLDCYLTSREQVHTFPIIWFTSCSDTSLFLVPPDDLHKLNCYNLLICLLLLLLMLVRGDIYSSTNTWSIYCWWTSIKPFNFTLDRFNCSFNRPQRFKRSKLPGNLPSPGIDLQFYLSVFFEVLMPGQGLICFMIIVG